MNAADSRYLAAALEDRGFEPVESPDQAGVIVLNTCVVRQKAEDKAHARLGILRRLKEKKPDTVIALMGCLVGVNPSRDLRRRFPFVDVFLPPSQPGALLDYLRTRTSRGNPPPATASLLPPSIRGHTVIAQVPVIFGCSLACSFCVIPYRRGPERSRPRREIVAEIESLAANGIREVILLGQIIDRYGLDLAEKDDLASLLKAVAAVEGIRRVRFLTSHPNWISDSLLETVAGEERICPHFEIALQSGSDPVLERMRRGYTADEFRRLVARIRRFIPSAAIHTDIIVGFPGESEEDFLATHRIIEELRFDKVHVAAYSPRPGTLAALRYPDDVPSDEKARRLAALERVQNEIQIRKNETLIGSRVSVLVEGRRNGKCFGRTPQDRLTFFTDDGSLRPGDEVSIEITSAGAHSLRGRPATAGQS